jgi:hypothetical protein
MPGGHEDDSIEHVDGDGSVNRRTFVQGVGMLPISTPLLNNEQVREGSNLAERPRNGRTRQFTIHAIEVDIVYNRFGLHQPDGVMYVLDENLDAVREASGVTPDDAFSLVEDETASTEQGGSNRGGNPNDDDDEDDTSLIEPLGILANEGDTVQIRFVNHLDRQASIHQTSLPYNVTTSDGMAVGLNPDTTAEPGGTVQYRWEATHTGAHFFYDGANQAVDSADEPPEEANLLSRGLFGAISVQPEGASWSDPETGGELRSGTHAVIEDPDGLGTTYREFVPFYHTPEGIRPEVNWPGTDVEQTIHAINYRADPLGQRVNDDCPECDIKDAFYHSWTNGDPGGGDAVFPTYKGDPIKWSFVGASLEENHVHHLHQHRWKEGTRTAADTLDSQTIGLGDTFDAYLVAGHGPRTNRPDTSFLEAFEAGAGYNHDSVGDVLFHCHLFPHYGEGMWGIMRIHDKEQPDLVPLPNTGDIISPPDSDTPGYPEFVADAIREVENVNDPIGYIAPKPPLSSENNPRQPTDVEEEVFGPAEDIVRGAPYEDPCTDPEPNRIIEYNVVVLSPGNPNGIVYNDAGDHDPDGLAYVLDQVRIKDPENGTVQETFDVDDAELLREGKLNPEPLFVRANVGDCIEINLQNELVDQAFGTSVHPHFVGFDPLASDSVTTGFNYDQATDPGDTMQYRWYADEEGAIYFHDHVVGVEEGMHGLFCGLIVEPEGSEWTDPYSGDPIYSGAQAIIDPPNSDAFREQALHYHDFAQLKDLDGNFVNPDREHDQNAGTMAINYRNSPFYHRDNEDAAYVHSSQVHGDPETPVLEAYDGDQIRLRLFQGSYEEQHNFGLHGLRFDPEGFAEQDMVSQVIGTSEAFTFRVPSEETQQSFEHITNPDDLPVRDYRYGSNIIDDMWTGMWGLTRIWGSEVDHLQTLPDVDAQEGDISEEELRTMGHPAPFSDFDWTEEGQRAKLRYAEDDDLTRPPDRNARQNGSVGPIPPTPADDGKGPGEPCPDDAPVRSFDVTAFQVEIPYNDYGDRDQYGVVFALDRYVDEIKNGDRPVTPLTLHANQGDCIEINLTNDLPGGVTNDHSHPKMRVSQEWDRSERISLHPLQVIYDVNGSNASTIGFNYDTTVDRGETITYRWYADVEVGTSILWDMADIRSTRHHGGFGQLVIEPEDAVTLDNETGEVSVTSAESMIKLPGGEPDFRENALIYADGQFILNRDDPDSCVVPPGPDIENPEDPCNQLGDPEDHGYASINYRAEPFIRRFENNDAQHLVYSSRVHGDPNTPVLNAVTNDPVKFRVAAGADKARANAFHLAEHQWQRFQGVDESPIIGVDGQLSPGKALTLDLLGGAGGLGTGSGNGDYIYQETKQRRRLEAGLWGIFRVRRQVGGFPGGPLQPLPDRAGRVPLTGRPGYVVRVGDVTGNGQQDVIIGVPGSNIGAAQAGAVYVFTDTNPGQVTDLSNADLQVPNEAVGERAGTDIRLGSRDGDGQDIVVGTSGGTQRVIKGGQSLVDIIESPPPSDISTFIRETANTDVRSIVSFDRASTPMD